MYNYSAPQSPQDTPRLDHPIWSMPAARPANAGSCSQDIQLPHFFKLPQHLTSLGNKAINGFKALRIRDKALVALVALVHLFFVAALIRLGPHRILDLAQISTSFSQSSLGPLFFIAIITLLSFPPTIGYGTSITLCGLAYGSPQASPSNSLFYAWFVAASGCFTGSLTAFLACRYALNHHGNQWKWIRRIREGREWKTMEKAVERQGWRMIVLIRLFPFPFVYSNLFFASLRPATVPIHLFLLATLATTPKLLLHVFVGAQTFEAIQVGRVSGADGHSQSAEGWIKMVYIIGASSVGAVTSCYIYRETKKSLEAFSEGDDEEAELESGDQNRRHGTSLREAGRALAQAHHGNGFALPRRQPSREPSPLVSDDQQENWRWSDEEADSSQIRHAAQAKSASRFCDERSAQTDKGSSNDTPDVSGYLSRSRGAERVKLLGGSSRSDGTSNAVPKSRLD